MWFGKTCETTRLHKCGQDIFEAGDDNALISSGRVRFFIELKSLLQVLSAWHGKDTDQIACDQVKKELLTALESEACSDLHLKKAITTPKKQSLKNENPIFHKQITIVEDGD